MLAVKLAVLGINWIMRTMKPTTFLYLVMLTVFGPWFLWKVWSNSIEEARLNQQLIDIQKETDWVEKQIKLMDKNQ